MSVAQAADFINLCNADDDVAKAVEAAPDRAARESLASSKGFDFTPEEMSEALAAQAQSSNGELSDEALSGVAGGGITIGIPGGGGISIDW